MPFGVVPFNPLSNGGAGFGETMLPDAFFFEAAKEAFDEALLFGRSSPQSRANNWHLGADPEIRTPLGGTLVANLSVATADSWTNKVNKAVAHLRGLGGQLSHLVPIHYVPYELWIALVAEVMQ